MCDNQKVRRFKDRSATRLSMYFLIMACALPARAEQAFRGPLAITLSGVVGKYTTKDGARFRSSSGVKGAFLDVTSSVALSPSYSFRRKEHAISLSIPLVVDYGLEVGLVDAPQAFPSGSAQLTMVRGHIDLLRVFSVGGGGYYATFSGQPWPMRQNGIGGFAVAQFNILPAGWIHPIVDLRWLGNPMPGQMVMFGIRVGQGN